MKPKSLILVLSDENANPALVSKIKELKGVTDAFGYNCDKFKGEYMSLESIELNMFFEEDVQVFKLLGVKK